MKASIKGIVDALEVQSDEHPQFLDRQTGEVELIERDVLRMAEAEDPDELLDWQEHEFELATQLMEDRDRFVKLPTSYDIHEWEIMREFAESVTPERFSNDLLNALHGKGAFRYFKDTLYRYHREKEWFAFRDAALRQIAVDWCKEHGIEYQQD